MDFSTFDIGVEAEKKKSAPKKTTETVTFEQFRNGNGKAFEATLLIGGTPEANKEFRRWNMKYASVRGDHFGASDEVLDSLIERDDASAPELAARYIPAWNLFGPNGKAVECTMENKMAFLKAWPEVMAAVFDKVRELTETLGNSKAS